jgi:RHS repeat-associated protein
MRPRVLRRLIISAGSILAVLFAWSSPASAQNENETVGFQTNHVFESGQFGENIDVMNGGLSLTIPIGQSYQVSSNLSYQLVLSYSSKVWDTSAYKQADVPLADSVMPYNEGPFGIGFTMHFGRIYSDSRWSDSCEMNGQTGGCYIRTWRWVAPDGSQHEFHFDDGLSATQDQQPPPFSGRLTSDGSFVKIYGPEDTDCYPIGTTQCMHVKTPDGLILTLAKRVNCLETQDNALRRDSLSYCGWYTTLIEDPSVGTRQNGMYPHHVEIAYASDLCQEHIISTVTDSVGRKLIFNRQRLPGGLTPATCELPGNVGSPTGRAAFAVGSVNMPAVASATFLPTQEPGQPGYDESTRAVYGFHYGLGPLRVANYDFEFDPLPLMTGRSFLSLTQIDYPHYSGRAGGASPDDYSVYFGYVNECDGNGPVPRACEEAQGSGNGDYGEITCRTLPVRRLAGGANPCYLTASPAPRFKYTYWYYHYISAFLSGGKAGGKAKTGQNQFNFGGGVGGHINAIGFTRSVNRKTLEMPTDPSVSPPNMVPYKWDFMRGETTTVTNPTKVTVRDPFGNDTVYQYRGSPSSNQSTPQPGDGLNPEDGFAPEWDDGVNDRIDYYEGTETVGRLVRSEIKDFDSDRQYQESNSQRHNKDDVRVFRSETVHQDDGGQKQITAYEDRDDYGHFRLETHSGFEVNTPKIIYRDYIPPGGSCAPPGYECGLGVYRTDLVKFEEVIDGQRVLARTDNRYDNRGRLVESVQRVVLPGTPLSPWSVVAQQGDVRTTFTHSPSSGNLITKQVTTGDVADHGYTIAYGYAPAIGTCTVAGECGGYLATKEFLNPDGTIPGVRWKAIDRDRDVNTGRVLQARDTAGIATNYAYDGLGRVTMVSPAQEDPTEIDYDSLLQTTVYQGNRNSSDFIMSRYRYDGLGRLLTTYKRAADAETDGGACQKTTYDIIGRVTSTSNWKYTTAADPCSPLAEEGHVKTVFEFTDPGTGKTDPFGRVRRQVPPDGSAATGDKITRYSYFGNSVSVEVQGIRSLEQTLLNTKSTQYHDALGRLVHVDVDSGRFCDTTLKPCTSDSQCSSPEWGDGNCSDLMDAAKAAYEYDGLDRLVRVELTDDQMQSQIRRFGFDGAGRPSWTENPENGTTLVTKYDGLGNPLVSQDAKGNIRKTLYDRAGRPTQESVIPAEGGGERTTALYTYDESGRGASLGKLTTVASRDGSGNPILTDQRTYGGLGGRLSDMNYIFSDWPAGLAEKLSYIYDARGQVTHMTYPRETIPTHDVLDLDYQYRNGSLLKALVGGTDRGSVKYDASGAIEEVLTRGGGKTTMTFDTRNRPRTITGGIFNTTSGHWTYESGQYEYDGAGNIWAIGANHYGYDAANRLYEAYSEVPGASFREVFFHDAFGNQINHLIVTGYVGEEDYRTYASPGGHGTNQVASRFHYQDGVSSSGVEYEYDANGSVTLGGRYELGGRDVKRYQYNALNQLFAIHQVLGSGSSEYVSEIDRFAYDSSGNRITKTQHGTGLRTYYIRDPSGRLLSEFRRVAGETSIPEWAKDELYIGSRSFGIRENKRPGPPVSLQIINTDPVQLSWAPNPESDVVGYNVYRRQVNLGEAWGPVALGLQSATFVEPEPFPIGTNLNYQVTAVDSAGSESIASPVARLLIGDATPPSKPTLSVTAGNGEISLSWSASTDSSGILGYELSRRTSLNDPSVPVTPSLITTQSYLDANLTNGVTYYYIVRAKDVAGNWGPFSCPSFPPGVICDKTAIPKDFVPPSPPKEFQVTKVCPASGDQNFSLSWAPNPDSDQVSQYYIYRGATAFLSSSNYIGSTNDTHYLDESSTAGIRYYAVKAVDNASPVNVSAFSEVRAGLARDASVSAAYPITAGPYATASDGSVDLSWVSSPAAQTYRIYRKVNSFESCGDYQLIGQTGSPGGFVYTFRDSTVPNNHAYDYAIAPVSGSTEGQLSRSVLAVPLARPSEELRQCGTYEGGSVVIKWRHPLVFRPYQPLSVDGEDPSQAYLKGYHLYHYKQCLVPNYFGPESGCPDLYYDNSPMRKVLVDVTKKDPFLLTATDAGFEYKIIGGFETTLSPALILEPGSYMEYLPYSCYHPSAGLMDNDERDCDNNKFHNCVMPRAVYSVYADGTWMGMESDWPDYWQGGEMLSNQRCHQYFGDPIDSPSCQDLPQVPVPPSNVTATSHGEGEITVSWVPGAQPVGEAVSQYYIYMQQALTGNSEGQFRKPLPFAVAPASATSYTFRNLARMSGWTISASYRASVAAVDQLGWISTATVADNAVPGPESSTPGSPRSIRRILWTLNDATQANARSRQGIKLAWTDSSATNPTVLGHRVYRGMTANGPWCAMLQAGALASDPPLPESVPACENVVGALSNELTTDGSHLLFWDRTTQPEPTYYYRVTQVVEQGGVKSETPYLETPVLSARMLPYEGSKLPPVTGLRAWAPWNSQEKAGINLDWCKMNAGNDPEMPAIAGYNIYRYDHSGGPYQYLVTVPASCLDEGHRCEIRLEGQTFDHFYVEDCSSQPNSCFVQSCSESVGSCHIADRTFDTHGVQPLPELSPADQLNNYVYYYMVTATKSMTNPTSPANESQASLVNAGFLNYQGWYKRYDPEGDGDLPRDAAGHEVPWCGDQDSGFRMPGFEQDVVAETGADVDGETGRSSSVSPYRTIGQGSGYPPYRFLYYHLDHLGSTRVITDEDGVVVSQHHYLAYGEERPGAVEASLNTRAFTGHERDSDTGLDYMLARYYSSSLGRFMAVDPVQRLAQSLGNPQRWNRFTYALNNPVGFIDPDGRDVTVPKNMRSAVISGYMHSSEFRQQFDAAKSNHNINVTLKLVEPVGGGVRPGEKASSPELKVTPNATDLQGKPVVSEGFKVEGNALIPAGKGEQEAATMAGHELKHANDMSVSGPQTPGTPAATAGQTAAEGSEAQIREEYKDPADDVSKAQAEAALKGTEPKKKTKDK